ncbi:MAG: MgtC/SapB family protein [Thermomicrobiales bacterium]
MADLYALTETDAIIRAGVALAAGAALGLEREWQDKPAGLRTYALVCEGAALFMVGSILLGHEVMKAGGLAYDPSRIGSTIVQGIGFLAGGVILATGRRVRNMTTAAGIWVTASVGLLLGSGFFLVGIAATIGTIMFLTIFRWLEIQFFPRGPGRTAEDMIERQD